MERNGVWGVIMAIEESTKDIIAKGFLITVVAVVIIMLLGVIYFTKGWLGISITIAFVSFTVMLGWSLNRLARR